MVKSLFLLAVIFVTVAAGLWLWQDKTYDFGSAAAKSVKFLSNTAEKPIKTESTQEIGVAEISANLAQYSIETLRNRTYVGSEIKLGQKIADEDVFTSYVFSFTTDGKKVTGQANIPKRNGKLPVVVMVRGYIDKEVYFTGLGTRKAAAKFAENGYITLAPDFLGFGRSDGDSGDILEARFEKPITVLNLLASIGNLSNADTENIFLWGHSNGGQISISALEILKKPIPTTLWAPVTRGFPESVTDYIGEMDDQGKMVIATLSAFTTNYNPKHFSVANYYQDITSPIQLHQGTYDALIKEEWSKAFIDKLKNNGLDVTYYVYPKDDHNLSKNWDQVVERDLDFFKKHLRS